MEKKIYLSLLTLWALFSQGIGTLSEKKMSKSIYILNKKISRNYDIFLFIHENEQKIGLL